MTLGEGFELTAQSDSTHRSLWRAEAWRLWRTWRWYALGVWVLMLLDPVTKAFAVLTGVQTAPRATLEQVLLPEVFNLHFTLGAVRLQLPLHVFAQPAINSFDLLVTMVFTCVMVANDRTRGSALFALSGPTARWTQWRVQTAAVFVVPVAAWVVKALIVLLVDASANWVLPVHFVAAWCGENVLFACTVAATAVFAVGGIGQAFVAVLFGIGLSAALAVAGGVLEGIGGRLLGSGNSTTLYFTGALPRESFTGQPWVVHLGHFLTLLSPLGHIGFGETVSWGGSGLPSGSSSPSDPTPLHVLAIDSHAYLPLWLVAWFLVWTLFFLYLSWRVSKVTPVERWQKVFMAPGFRTPALWMSACFLALIGANGLARLAGVNFLWSFVIVFLVVGISFQWRWSRRGSPVTRKSWGGGR